MLSYNTTDTNNNKKKLKAKKIERVVNYIAQPVCKQECIMNGTYLAIYSCGTNNDIQVCSDEKHAGDREEVFQYNMCITRIIQDFYSEALDKSK